MEGTYYIINMGCRKHLDTHGHDVSVWSDGSLENKGVDPPAIQWELKAAAKSGTFHIVNVGCRKYLDTHGSKVTMWRDGSLENKGVQPDNITWQFEPSGGNSYYIINVGHAKFLDTHGSTVSVWSDGPLSNRGPNPENLQWELQRVSGGDGDEVAKVECKLVPLLMFKGGSIGEYKDKVKLEIGSERRDYNDNFVMNVASKASYRLNHFFVSGSAKFSAEVHSAFQSATSSTQEKKTVEKEWHVNLKEPFYLYQGTVTIHLRSGAIIVMKGDCTVQSPKELTDIVFLIDVPANSKL